MNSPKETPAQRGPDRGIETRFNHQTGIQGFACVEQKRGRTWELPILLCLIRPGCSGRLGPKCPESDLYLLLAEKGIHSMSPNLLLVSTEHSYKEDLGNP